MMDELVQGGILWKAGLVGLPLFVALCFSQEIALRNGMRRAAKVYRAIARVVLLLSVTALLMGVLTAVMS